MLYLSSTKGPYKMQGYHDPDSITTLDIVFRPATWQANTVYTYINDNEYSVVLPTVYKGYYYRCINGGKSGATEPTWALVKDGETEDFESGATEGLKWAAVPYNLMPPARDVSSIAYSATNGVTISNTSNTTIKAILTIDAIDSNAAARTVKKFQFKLRVTFSDGQLQDYTFERKIAER